MRDKEYNFDCSSCGVAFTLITQDTDKPMSCPFCSEDLQTDRDSDEYEED